MDTPDPNIQSQTGWRRWLWPLFSRKVQVAIASLLVAYGSQVGWHLDQQWVLYILGIGGTIIAGIAVEDHGKHVGNGWTNMLGSIMALIPSLSMTASEQIQPTVTTTIDKPVTTQPNK
jgi:hypothetical protein